MSGRFSLLFLVCPHSRLSFPFRLICISHPLGDKCNVARACFYAYKPDREARFDMHLPEGGSRSDRLGDGVGNALDLNDRYGGSEAVTEAGFLRLSRYSWLLLMMTGGMVLSPTRHGRQYCLSGGWFCFVLSSITPVCFARIRQTQKRRSQAGCLQIRS